MEFREKHTRNQISYDRGTDYAKGRTLFDFDGGCVASHNHGGFWLLMFLLGRRRKQGLYK